MNVHAAPWTEGAVGELTYPGFPLFHHLAATHNVDAGSGVAQRTYALAAEGIDGSVGFGRNEAGPGDALGYVVDVVEGDEAVGVLRDEVERLAEGAAVGVDGGSGQRGVGERGVVGSAGEEVALVAVEELNS